MFSVDENPPKSFPEELSTIHMVEYYDLLLGSIVGALTLGLLVGSHPAVAFHVGLGGGSVLASILLFDAIFRNPPTAPTNLGTAAAVLVGLAWFVTGASIVH